MTKLLNQFLDNASEFLARRKGLLPFAGILLVILNFLLVLIMPESWISSTNLLLHLGLITAISGFLLAWAL